MGRKAAMTIEIGEVSKFVRGDFMNVGDVGIVHLPLLGKGFTVMKTFLGAVCLNDPSICWSGSNLNCLEVEPLTKGTKITLTI